MKFGSKKLYIHSSLWLNIKNFPEKLQSKIDTYDAVHWYFIYYVFYFEGINWFTVFHLIQNRKTNLLERSKKKKLNSNGKSRIHIATGLLNRKFICFVSMVACECSIYQKKTEHQQVCFHFRWNFYLYNAFSFEYGNFNLASLISFLFIHSCTVGHFLYMLHVFNFYLIYTMLI